MKVLPKTNAGNGSILASVARLTAASALTLVLAACSGAHHRYSEPGGLIHSDSAQAHPIMVSKKPVYLDIDVERGSGGLTRVQENHIRGFLHQYRSQGAGRLQISSPSGTPNEAAAFEAMRDIRHLVSQVGLSDSSVDIEPYHDEGDHQPPIKISFVRYVAEGPTCGDWSDNVGNTDKNAHWKNFGCATQKNLASMIANPKDLIEKRGHDQRDGDRRDDVLRKYSEGKDYTAETPRSESEQTVSGLGQ